MNSDAWKELIMALCDVISSKLTDGTGKKHETPRWK